MTDDLKIPLPGKRAALFMRKNRSFYVVSAMGTQIELANASPEVFSLCSEMLGMSEDMLMDLCEPVPPTEPAPASAP